jgi:hypothetical protein
VAYTYESTDPIKAMAAALTKALGERWVFS